MPLSSASLQLSWMGALGAQNTSEHSKQALKRCKSMLQTGQLGSYSDARTASTAWELNRSSCMECIAPGSEVLFEVLEDTEMSEAASFDFCCQLSHAFSVYVLVFTQIDLATTCC